MYMMLCYIVGSFVIIEICYYGILCRPFSDYWALPVSNLQCATYQYYSIIQMTFNISSDMMLVALPCYMTAITGLSVKRKAVLMIVFSMALLTIAAAIVNK
jgi:hypothetical protein